MNEAVVEEIVEFIHKRSRLWYGEHKRATLKKGIKERMTALVLDDVSIYWHHLRSTSAEESILVDLITVNETSFFRNPCQFDFLANRIVPALENKQRVRFRELSTGSKVTIRMLSAGCSTGEEPYSAAMVILDSLKQHDSKIEIIAGDISASCLKTAAEGFFPTHRVKGLPQKLLKKYTMEKDDGIQVKDQVKSCIRFCSLNLDSTIKGDPIPGDINSNGTFDIIFCRNVMIYFSFDTQQQLIDTLYRLLAPGGYLFTGDVEPLHMYNHKLETVRESGCLIYRKAENPL